MANARPYEFLQYEAIPNMIDIPAGAFPARKPYWWISSGVPGLSEDSRTWNELQWDEHKRLANLDLVLQKPLMLANFEVRCDAERLTDIPSIYQTVFHRTGKFALTVEKLATSSVVANGSDGAWGQVACFLVTWTTGVLRHEAVRFHNFLQSQRESIYWILDNALLRILLSQWENDSSPSPTTTTTTPWDIATRPLALALSRAEALIPQWVDQEFEELQTWKVDIIFSKEVLEKDYFRRSRKFLEQSRRISEIWRTVRLWGEGRLPAELANGIVEDVCRAEELPMGSLRDEYVPTGKKCKQQNGRWV